MFELQGKEGGERADTYSDVIQNSSADYGMLAFVLETATIVCDLVQYDP